MPEMYWLFLLLAAVAGWLLARILYKRTPQPKIPGEYLKGLNYLLNEQPDKALEVFIELVDVDTETVETHLVLGNMFRRRGEVDRAIRIHQNLIARPTLEAIYKSTALLELAKDYLKAGLLDRAEVLFNDVIEIGLQNDEAYPLLLGLYEKEKEWVKAIETTRKLEKVSGNKMDHITAHYYCELSELAFKGSKGNITDARKLAKRALAFDKNCARASLLLGEFAMHEGSFRAAIKYLKAVYVQNPAYLPEVLPKLREAYVRSHDLKGFAQFLATTKSSELSGMTFTNLLNELVEDKQERALILNWLKEKSELSILEVNALLKSKQKTQEDVSTSSLSKIQISLESFIQNRNTHQCRQCGFHGKLLYWQCPGCHSWGTVVPIMPKLT